MALHEVDIWNRALSRVGDARLVPEASLVISAATAANPVLITHALPSPVFVDDDLILIRGMDEMTEVNGRVFKLNVLTTTTAELLEEDGTAYTAETTGGTLQKLPTTKRSKAAFDAWTNIRDEVLESHPWANVTRRSRAARLEASRAITGATAANPVRITCVAHGYTTGDLVLIEDIVGQIELNDRFFIISQVFVGVVEDPDLFDLNTEDGTLHTAYVSGGTSKKALTPLTPDSGYGHRYALPSDSLRIVELTDSRELWMVENGELHTNEGITAPIRYIFRQRDVTAYRPALENALEFRLALELNEELTQSNSKRQRAFKEWETFLARAQHIDSLEQSPKPIQEDDWILSRLSGSPTSRRFR
ncbi:MAG: hypothetical protein V3R16_02410 [Nitrospirales bacterium]